MRMRVAIQKAVLDDGLWSLDAERNNHWIWNGIRLEPVSDFGHKRINAGHRD